MRRQEHKHRVHQRETEQRGLEEEPAQQQQQQSQEQQQQRPPPEALPRGQMTLICGSVFLYAVCFMAQAPLLPYVITSKIGGGSGSNEFALLTTTFSVLQLIGGLLSGPLVDAYGGKALLLLSFAASAACYGMTASATTMAMLFLSRLATLAQHAVLAARTVVAKRTAQAERAGALGRVSASYGLGFALGPAAGGWLSAVSLEAAAWAAAAGSVLALLVVAVGLPADAPGKPSSSEEGQQQDQQQERPRPARGGFDVASLAAVLRCPGVPQLIAVQLAVGLAQGVFQGTFTLVLKQRFQLSSKANGMTLSYVGMCIVFAQALLIQPLSRRLGEPAAVRVGCGLMAASYACMAASTQLWQLLACLLPLAVSGVLVATINTARLTKAVPPSQAGAALSLDMSLGSGGRAIAPLLGSWLLRARGFPAVCCFSAAMAGGVLLLPPALAAAAARGQQREKREE